MLLPNYSSAIEANCFFPRPVSFVHLVSRLRKEKSLQLGKNISKVGDLKAFVLATCLARVHPQVTEQQLMRVGGEAFELRRKALSEFRVSDTAESLNIRVALRPWHLLRSCGRDVCWRFLTKARLGHFVQICLLDLFWLLWQMPSMHISDVCKFGSPQPTTRS